MRYLFIFYFSLFSVHVTAQDHEIDQLVKILDDESNQQVHKRAEAYRRIQRNDSATQIKWLHLLEDRIGKNDKRRYINYVAFKARTIHYLTNDAIKKDTTSIIPFKKAFLEAEKLDEPFMSAEFSRYYGEMLYDKGEKDLALQYCLNAALQIEELGKVHFPNLKALYLTIGELFFSAKVYPQAIIYLRKGILEPDDGQLDKGIVAIGISNLAFTYGERKQYDSSLFYFEACMKYANLHGLKSWFFNAHDSRFESFLHLKQYDSCLKIANIIYEDGMTDTSAQVLLMAHWQFGEIALAQKDYEKALMHYQKAFNYRSKTSMDAFDLSLNKGISEIYEALKQPEKAFPYYKEFMRLNAISDYNNRVINESYLFAKANFEKEKLQILKFKRSYQKGILVRNVSIGVILLAAGFVVFMLNKKRRIAIAKQKQAEQSIRNFLNDTLAKNEEIETLKLTIATMGQSQDVSNKIEALSQKVILTEADWTDFQKLFESAFPGYILRLREKARQITEAELRLALLLRLKLTNKHIATMQGVGIDTVHKTKQRLRARFLASSSVELEQILLDN